MKVLITGSNGFIAKNLRVHLGEKEALSIDLFSRDDSVESLNKKIAQADFIFHLAGINRPKMDDEFISGNTELTHIICDAVKGTGRNIPIIYSSSIQAEQDNPYGKSKRAAENVLKRLNQETGNSVYIYRLPNVFGKWARPNYNSAVATFCHNTVNDLPININDASAVIHLVYIDDVIESFLNTMESLDSGCHFIEVQPIYNITVGTLATQLKAFKDSRDTIVSEKVGTGLVRALYSTYLSYLKPESFDYEVPLYGDPRGEFVEMLKTPNTGQFSYFTAFPGITRGGHYHHTKTEKFLVIRGKALFKFKHIMTDEYFEIEAQGGKPRIVETVPGWTHDITNIGDEEMVVMLWANEIFDREKPDTYSMPL